MDGMLLSDIDDHLRTPGPHLDWSESRYLDFHDPATGLAGWFRIGNRPHRGFAELSACVHLPDGRAAVAFGKPAIEGNVAAVAGLGFSTTEPFVESELRFHGPMSMLDSPQNLVNPGPVLRASATVSADIRLVASGDGLRSVLGSTQDHVEKIFLPGQATGHFQQLVATRGHVALGGDAWQVNAVGGRDRSWGPRNWHAKRYFRWLVGRSNDGFGFMLTCGANATERRRGGFVWDADGFHWVDDFTLSSRYEGPHAFATSTSIAARSGRRAWLIRGRQQAHLPLRHRRRGDDGVEAVLRIVKSPTCWTVDGERPAWGITEFHDAMENGQPADLSE
jgi:hypothetical protein